MAKKLIIAAAISGLMASTALAQSSNSPAMNTPAKSDQIQTHVAADAKFVTTQSPDQLLASKFIGTNVIGPSNEKVGDVSDVLFDKSGKALAYVVGVGGFLGIGKKDVALEPASFNVIAATDTADLKLSLAMTKDELKRAPDFKPYQPPRASAGLNNGPAGTIGLGGGSGGMNRPASPPATPPASSQ